MTIVLKTYEIYYLVLIVGAINWSVFFKLCWDNINKRTQKSVERIELGLRMLLNCATIQSLFSVVYDGAYNHQYFFARTWMQSSFLL